MMRAIANRLVIAVFAATEMHDLILVRGKLDRGETGTFVRAIAEGLRRASATGAPEIALAGLHRNREGAASGDSRLSTCLFGSACCCAFGVCHVGPCFHTQSI